MRLGRRLVGHAFPPHAAVGRERDVREDGVRRERRHRVRVGLVTRAGRDAEEARLGVDGAQAPVLVRLDPRDVVADGRDLPALC